jgi:hypothetical protein
MEESADSKAAHKEEYWEPEFMHGGFAAQLNCDNPACKNIVFFSGEINLDVFQDYNGGDTFEVETEWILLPKYFSQQIHLIPISDRYNNEIANLLLSSFDLFWIDLDSCANKIRTIVENILNTQKIPQYSRNKGKLKRISLHSRILKFELKNKALAKLMLAIKWIGNYASHESGLSREDLIQAYEMLELVLSNLYDNKLKIANKMAALINKKKAPKSIVEKRKAARNKGVPTF